MPVQIEPMTPEEFGILPSDYQTVIGPGDLYYSGLHADWRDIPPKWYGHRTHDHPNDVFRRTPVLTLTRAWTDDEQEEWRADGD